MKKTISVMLITLLAVFAFVVSGASPPTNSGTVSNFEKQFIGFDRTGKISTVQIVQSESAVFTRTAQQISKTFGTEIQTNNLARTVNEVQSIASTNVKRESPPQASRKHGQRTLTIYKLTPIKFDGLGSNKAREKI